MLPFDKLIIHHESLRSVLLTTQQGLEFTIDIQRNAAWPNIV